MEKYGVAIADQIKGLQAELTAIQSKVQELCSPIPSMVKTAHQIHEERSELEKQAGTIIKKIRELEALNVQDF